MNWRRLILRYASLILRDLGKIDLAGTLWRAQSDLPALDGGCLWIARRETGSHAWTITSPFIQDHARRPENDTAVLVPLPSTVWDEPACCSHACCGKEGVE